jgi:hypothetical protein
MGAFGSETAGNSFFCLPSHGKSRQIKPNNNGFSMYEEAYCKFPRMFLKFERLKGGRDEIELTLYSEWYNESSQKAA